MSIQENKSEKEEGLLGFCVFLILSLAAFAYHAYERNLDARYKRQIAASYSETQGEIVAYQLRSSADGGNSTYIQYGYKVDGKRFSRDVITLLNFPECKDITGVACARKRFWVIYSTEDPNKSVINLKMEIQDMEHPKPPQGIDDDFI